MAVQSSIIESDPSISHHIWQALLDLKVIDGHFSRVSPLADIPSPALNRYQRVGILVFGFLDSVFPETPPDLGPHPPLEMSELAFNTILMSIHEWIDADGQGSNIVVTQLKNVLGAFLFYKAALDEWVVRALEHLDGAMETFLTQDELFPEDIDLGQSEDEDWYYGEEDDMADEYYYGDE